MRSRRVYQDLEAYFEHSGDTQKALAARLGLSQPCISLIRNKKRTPSLPVAIRIARATNIPVESLLPADALR